MVVKKYALLECSHRVLFLKGTDRVDFQVSTLFFFSEKKLLLIDENMKYSTLLPRKIQVPEIFNTMHSFKRSQVLEGRRMIYIYHAVSLTSTLHECRSELRGAAVTPQPSPDRTAWALGVKCE